MRKTRIISAVVIIIALTTGIFFAIRPSQPAVEPAPFAFPQEKLARTGVRIGGEDFEVMIARTKAEQSLGLGGLPSLKPNEAMIFPYASDDSYGFWMKDMLFPIDIVWLDKNSKIVWIEKNVSPYTYPSIYFPRVPARSVLELSSGTADRLGVTVGSVLEIDLSAL